MMEAQQDNGGFELQVTMPVSTQPAKTQNQEKRKSTSTELPKVPDNDGSLKGPPKPSKSSTFPKNGTTKTTATVENGNSKNKSAEAASETKTGFLSVNVGFFQSWQAVLKIVKIVCLISMLIAFCVAVNAISRTLPKTHLYAAIWDSVKTLQFGISMSVIGLIIELIAFFYYLLGLNIAANKAFKSVLPWVFTICHGVMFLFVFVAPIVLNVNKWTGAAVTSFIAFDLLTVAGYSLELYFNVVWIAGGPELARLPCL